jgi:hypothetical protein
MVHRSSPESSQGDSTGANSTSVWRRFCSVDASAVETLFFHVGSRQNGLVIRPDEFERGFWRSSGQLVVHVGHCSISVLAGGELGTALER